MNLEIYNHCFVRVLGVEPGVLGGLKYGEFGWTSFPHLLLVSEIEKTFNIMFDHKAIAQLSSYENGLKLLRNYGIVLD